MIVTDEMAPKVKRALEQGGNFYSLDDIEVALAAGDMQGHVEGQTWAITQVHTWPHTRSVNILFVIGNLDESLRLEARIIDWAKSIGATILTGIGRDGWWENRSENWKKVGTLYSKEI